MKYIITLFLIPIFLYSPSLFAQQESGDDVSLFYQKSKQSNSFDYSNALSTDLMSIIGGELPVIWGHKFSDHFELNIGAGLLLPYYVNLNPFSNFWNLDEEELKSFTNNDFGFSLFGGGRSYFSPSKTGGWYIDYFVHYRRYSTVGVFGFGTGSGWQQIMFNRFLLGLGLNVSVLSQNSLDGETKFFYSDSFSFDVCLGFSIKMGFIFN